MRFINYLKLVSSQAFIFTISGSRISLVRCLANLVDKWTRSFIVSVEKNFWHGGTYSEECGIWGKVCQSDVFAFRIRWLDPAQVCSVHAQPQVPSFATPVDLEMAMKYSFIAAAAFATTVSAQGAAYAQCRSQSPKSHNINVSLYEPKGIY